MVEKTVPITTDGRGGMPTFYGGWDYGELVDHLPAAGENTLLKAPHASFQVVMLTDTIFMFAMSKVVNKVLKICFHGKKSLI